jgi:hypothetical protein
MSADCDFIAVSSAMSRQGKHVKSSARDMDKIDVGMFFGSNMKNLCVLQQKIT